jgi:hypothetical protein
VSKAAGMVVNSNQLRQLKQVSRNTEFVILLNLLLLTGFLISNT